MKYCDIIGLFWLSLCCCKKIINTYKIMLNDILAPLLQDRIKLIRYYPPSFPHQTILTISASAKVVVATIHGTRTTTAKQIMDSFTFDDISTFFASDCVPDNSRYNQSLFSAFLIFSFSPLPSVRRRRSGTAHFSKTEVFFISRLACLLPTSWKPVPSTSIASTGCLSI